MDEQKAAAQRLGKRHSDALAERGGELEVRASKPLLSAGVTWREPNIYDHIDIDLQEEQLDEAFALVEGQIQEWIREGPPSL